MRNASEKTESEGRQERRGLLHSRASRIIPAAGLTVGLALGSYGIASAATNPTTQSRPGSQVVSHPAPTTGTGSGSGTANSGKTRPPRRPFVGTLAALTSTSVTVSGPGGTSRTFVTNASTTYHKDRTTVTRDALATGERIAVRVVPSPSGQNASASPSGQTPTAVAVDIVSPHLAGTVVSVSGNTITIADDQGMWRTVNVTASTTYTDAGTSATASDVTSGTFIVAVGSVDANHMALDATSVRIGMPAFNRGPGAAGPSASGGDGATSSGA